MKQEKKDEHSECEETRKRAEAEETEKTEALQTGAPADAHRIQINRKEYEELLKKSDEFAQLQDRLLRSAADFDNARKRFAKEREEFLKFALEDLIHDFLPVLDNLERALAHIDVRDDKTKAIRDGFVLTQRQLLQTLAERGLKRMEALGKPFDPNLYEAVEHVVSREEPEETVLEEILAGYQLNGKLLRPAKVKVSRRKVVSPEEKSEELT